MHDQIRPERPKYHQYYALSALDQIVFSYQGRRAPLRVALAPGFHISCLWRSVSTFVQSRFASRLPLAFIFRAFEPLFRLLCKAASLRACPWLSYFAPLALCFDFCAKPLRFALAPGFHISRLWTSVSSFCAKPLP
jgi:hypothetical protein